MTEALLLYAALAAIALLHGAAAGIRAAAGRDGLLDHRHTELLGALRGVGVVTAMLGPFAAVSAFHALTDPAMRDVYVQGAKAMLVVYAPIAGITAAAFVVARVARWEVRAFVDTVVLGGLEFARPALAMAGVAAAVVATRDPAVAALGSMSVVAGLQVSRVVARAWYRTPALSQRPVLAAQR